MAARTTRPNSTALHGRRRRPLGDSAWADGGDTMTPTWVLVDSWLVAEARASQSVEVDRPGDGAHSRVVGVYAVPTVVFGPHPIRIGGIGEEPVEIDDSVV